VGQETRTLRLRSKFVFLSSCPLCNRRDRDSRYDDAPWGRKHSDVFEPKHSLCHATVQQMPNSVEARQHRSPRPHGAASTATASSRSYAFAAQNDEMEEAGGRNVPCEQIGGQGGPLSPNRSRIKSLASATWTSGVSPALRLVGNRLSVADALVFLLANAKLASATCARVLNRLCTAARSVDDYRSPLSHVPR
jgi:hypothetical protein